MFWSLLVSRFSVWLGGRTARCTAVNAILKAHTTTRAVLFKDFPFLVLSCESRYFSLWVLLSLLCLYIYHPLCARCLVIA